MNILDNQRREICSPSRFLLDLTQFLLALSHSGEFIYPFIFFVSVYFEQYNQIFFPSVETFQSLGDLGNPKVLMPCMARSQTRQMFV